MLQERYVKLWRSKILSDLKCYKSAMLSSGDHLWSANEKDQWKNSKKKAKLFNLQNMFLFSSLDLSYF
jgi:hypothetical protein